MLQRIGRFEPQSRCRCRTRPDDPERLERGARRIEVAAKSQVTTGRTMVQFDQEPPGPRAWRLYVDAYKTTGKAFVARSADSTDAHPSRFDRRYIPLATARCVPRGAVSINALRVWLHALEGSSILHRTPAASKTSSTTPPSS